MKIATLCYIQKDGKTLMVKVLKEGFNKGKWNGLGGKLDEGETPEDCAIREVREESGLEIKNPKLCGILHFPNNLSSGDDWKVYVFTIKEFTGELINDSAEGDLKWIDDDKLLDLKLNQCDYIFFPWMREGNLFEATFDSEGKVLKSEFYNHIEELNTLSKERVTYNLYFKNIE